MENIKKRKIEETSANMDLQNIISNQEKMISYIYQIGSISENTFHTLQNIEIKLTELNQKINHLEIKNNYLEHSINKINNSFIQELKNKDSEINSLKELNKNIVEDYNALIQSNNNNNNNSNLKKDNNESFYL
jgi:hypothetical protein